MSAHSAQTLSGTSPARISNPKILQPTLFTTGTLDGVLKMAAEEYAALETNVPHLSKKQLIPGAGHWIQQERPTEVNELLVAFLRRCRTA